MEGHLTVIMHSHSGASQKDIPQRTIIEFITNETDGLTGKLVYRMAKNNSSADVLGSGSLSHYFG